MNKVVRCHSGLPGAPYSSAKLDDTAVARGECSLWIALGRDYLRDCRWELGSVIPVSRHPFSLLGRMLHLWDGVNASLVRVLHTH